jgi:hypothetical protein
MPRSRNSSRSRSRRDSSLQDSHGREIGPPVKESGDTPHTTQTRKGDSAGKLHGPPEMVLPDDHWIHRDKLARIENQELQQAAMRIQRQVRAGSKSSSMRGRSYDSHSNSLNGTVTTPPSTEYSEPWPNVQRQQLESPIPPEDPAQEFPSETERIYWDLRRPEEIAEEDSGSAKFYKSPGLKKSSSRIPILATSPLPISPDQVEREFSIIQRARTRTLGSGDDESVSRRASGSATVVDSPEASPLPVESSTPPMSSSRPVSRAGQSTSPTKKTSAKGSTARKTSAPPSNRKPSSTQKPRATSGSSTAKDRPVTRNGENRPSTAVGRPEGDPPWLATMYKPDPRLPPEQQMLPTHAKRMQQEMWEKEGKTPSMYDREFGPLAVRPDEQPRVHSPVKVESESPSQETRSDTPTESPAWPLRSLRSPELTNRPGTSGTNYSTMPKVQNTPPIGISMPQKVQQLPVAPEPEKEDKGCGCCIVM